MSLSTTHYARCIETLERSLSLLRQAEAESIEYEIFRNAVIAYRDNRNSTAHDYGVGFAEETLKLLPGFIEDARALEATLRERLGDAET